MAVELTNTTVSRGHVNFEFPKNSTAEERNYIRVKTIGWMVEMFYRELKGVPVKAARPEKKPRKDQSNVRVMR
jgi:hypothetical protein